jgi:hypothetical protein
MKPELKQFGNLTQQDFERFPPWVGVHTQDYDEPWYDEEDEETFRPWIGEVPVDPSIGMLLVRSQITLADKSKFVGFITPAFGKGKVSDSELGTVQPHLFIPSGGLILFWGGMFGFSDEVKNATYKKLKRTPKQVFPVRFSADSGLTKGRQEGKLRGFCKSKDFKSGKVEFSV